MLIRQHTPRSGFTLIELVIVVAILALVLMFGVPGFMEWSQNTQIRASAESIQAGLQSARSEAVRRNARIEFRLSDNVGQEGETGWSIVEVSTSTVLQSRPRAEGSNRVVVTTLPSGADIITFDGTGRTPSGASTNSDGSAFLTRINIDSAALSTASSRDLAITLSLGGQIRMCDPNVSTTGDPRKCS